MIMCEKRTLESGARSSNRYTLTAHEPPDATAPPPRGARDLGAGSRKPTPPGPESPGDRGATDPGTRLSEQDPVNETVSVSEDQGELFSLSSDNGKPNVARKGEPDLIRRVLEYYRDTYHPRALPKIHSKLRPWKLAKDRLSDGFTEDDLRQAIDGCHVSPFHCGENPAGTKYLSIEVIFRDAKQVQKFIEIHEARDEPVLSERTRRSKRAGEAWLKRMEAQDEQQ